MVQVQAPPKMRPTLYQLRQNAGDEDALLTGIGVFPLTA
jgi:hypothetical protein